MADQFFIQVMKMCSVFRRFLYSGHGDHIFKLFRSQSEQKTRESTVTLRNRLFRCPLFISCQQLLSSNAGLSVELGRLRFWQRFDAMFGHPIDKLMRNFEENFFGQHFLVPRIATDEFSQLDELNNVSRGNVGTAAQQLFVRIQFLHC